MSGEQLIRDIGRSGVKASAVGLGTWAIGGWMWGGTDEAQSIAAIQASLDAGVTLIDTGEEAARAAAELLSERNQLNAPDRAALRLPERDLRRDRFR